MRIFALTVSKNEAGRYLPSFLAHHKGKFDGHFFYDDGSTDGTPELALDAGCVVDLRPVNVYSFEQDEGMFRAAAWMAFESLMNPTEDDWVLVIDCDEFMVWNQTAELYPEVGPEFVAVDLLIPEVFWLDNGHPFIRTDRLWGTIHAPRLFRYRQHGLYHPGKFGVNAVPNYVMSGRWANTTEFFLLHYGYANPEDQQKKYTRYSGQPGHLHSHVESIISPDKKLERWQGECPKLLT